MKIFLMLAIISMTFSPSFSFANDGYASVGVGGIVLSKTDDIAIKSEVLDVSVDKIKVTYEFINESDKDVDATIIFPLPGLWADPRPDVIQIIPPNFSIKVDGKDVKYKTQVKAIEVDKSKPYKPMDIPEGKDVTDILRNIGFSDKQIAMMPFDTNMDNASKPVWTISKKQEKQLIAKKLMTKEDNDDFFSPNWAIVISYVWEQKFLAKAIVKVEHSYTPFVAGGSRTCFSNDDVETEELKKLYCLSDKQIKDLKKKYSKITEADRERGNQTIFGVPGAGVQYILTTANSWKDGVRDFKLRLHTKTKNDFVASCFPAEIKKVSDTLYEAHLENFKPKEELSVYFGNIWGEFVRGTRPIFKK